MHYQQTPSSVQERGEHKVCPEVPGLVIACRSRWPGRDDRRIQFRPGDTLFDALRAADQPIASSCSGNVVCGRCRVRVVEGHEALSESDAEERAILSRECADSDERLACRAIPRGPGVIVTTGYW
jgi:ferredoxin